jgi:hypothetical protein
LSIELLNVENDTLLTKSLKAMGVFQRNIIIGKQITLINVMNSIEKVFADTRLLEIKLSLNPKYFVTIIEYQATALMCNPQIGLICKLNSNATSDSAELFGCNGW